MRIILNLSTSLRIITVIGVVLLKGIAENEIHAQDHLQNYPTSGFKRVLIVPEDEIEAAVDWIRIQEDPGAHWGSITAGSPGRIGKRSLILRAKSLS
jgi:hypothetical protein